MTMPVFESVERRQFSVLANDGEAIGLRWYKKTGITPGSGIVYAHGGGMIAGNLDCYDAVIARYVHETGVPFLSVDYRLAPEVHGSTPAMDVFAGVLWLIEHASELGVDPARIAVMGDSGGGGVIAGTAIIARGQQVKLARQILIYPMLDDRNTVPDSQLETFATWTYDSNFTAWSALLGEQLATANVEPAAAPARLVDFCSLAPAYIEVGDLDIFRDESISFAQRLARAGVSAELHVHSGAPHGFDRFAPDSDLARRAMTDRMRIIRSI